MVKDLPGVVLVVLSCVVILRAVAIVAVVRDLAGMFHNISAAIV